jgi:hypothetical protein
MMEKISQRTHDDCTICAVAMVMGPPYTYERVLQDSKRYPMADSEGHGLAWWKDYLHDEGFETEHGSLSDLRTLSDFSSLPKDSRAMLVFEIPHVRTGHIVAIDQFGVIDPQEHPADYRSVTDFCEIFKIEGWRLYSPHFWLIRKRIGP